MFMRQVMMVMASEWKCLYRNESKRRMRESLTMSVRLLMMTQVSEREGLHRSEQNTWTEVS